jgi:regulator of protease activity HflC (stomatin/prohibitin superfamily)
MPRGRSSFTKRQKEQTRQQKQRDKAERRVQRKQDKPEGEGLHEMDELRQAAEAQAAMFHVGYEPPAHDEASEKKPNE